MVGVNMNHFDAQANVHIQNKIENSVDSGFAVLKAYKNGWTSWIDNKNYSATEVKAIMIVNLAFRPLNFSLHQNRIIHLLSAFEVFLPKFVSSKCLLSNLLPKPFTL